MIDWNTFAATLLPLGITAIAGGSALRVRTSHAIKELDEVKGKLAVHEKEDAEVHGNVREMRADIRWIRETLERMERK